MHKSLHLVDGDGGYRYGESGIETTMSCFIIPHGLYQKCAHVVSYDAEDPRLAGIPIMDISTDSNRHDSASEISDGGPAKFEG